MGYLYPSQDEALWMQAGLIPRPIRLGDVERRVILAARHDLDARRPGRQLADARLDALRRYAMRADRATAAELLFSAGFSAAERRVIDAMISTIPPRAESVRPSTGRLVFAALILLPLLAALGGYGWAMAYLEDNLIAFVVAGLALLIVTPLVSALIAPMPDRRHPA